jgi:hypothetical protein
MQSKHVEGVDLGQRNRPLGAAVVSTDDVTTARPIPGSGGHPVQTTNACPSTTVAVTVASRRRQAHHLVLSCR